MSVRKLTQGVGRGQWLPMRRPGHADTATIRCPECGGTQSITGYSIQDDGLVQPAFECNNRKTEECTFFDHVQLEGWNQ